MILKSPMLAASLMDSSTPHTDDNIMEAMSKLKKWPVLATTKLDGVRAVKWNGRLLSRTLKPIPNKIVNKLAELLPDYIDVELVIPTQDFNYISGIVRNVEDKKGGSIVFAVLDWIHPQLGYEFRLKKFERNGIVYTCLYSYEKPTLCTNPSELFDFFLLNEHNGAEGICFRTPESPYKQGRSTLKEQYLVKLSRYLSSEAIITGFVEQMENGNPDKRTPTGLMKRSTDSSNMLGKNTLGAIVCKDVKTNVSFNIGTGFSDKLRREIWKNRDCFVNKQITYKYKPAGMLNKPRHPSFVGFREKGY